MNIQDASGWVFLVYMTSVGALALIWLAKEMFRKD
jgi:hypothetical protein